MGTGGMWSYSIGFCDYMRQKFDLSNCKFSGISGGTMAAALGCQPTNIVNGKQWHDYTMIQGMEEIQNDYTYVRLSDRQAALPKTATGQILFLPQSFFAVIRR